MMRKSGLRKRVEMVSEENPSKGIDACVGGLVWVRRRNGSWWPGRIVGLDELSEDCLISPKSGTPVKLLGREDASVDWYNLEKSKRVKAFRCGEYDDCIERARASATNSNKKAVKYARREDAIIHALEIENTRNSNEKCSTRKVSSSAAKNDAQVREVQNTVGPGNDHKQMSGKACKHEGSSTQELSQSGISFEDPNIISTSNGYIMSKKRRKTPNDSEDDGTERTKRMKGLEDLGVGAASKVKAEKHLTFEGSHQLVQQDFAPLRETDIGNGLSNGSPLNRSKASLTLKRRRSQVTNFHECPKRKDRRRQLTKVLECTAMVSVPVFCNEGTSPSGSFFQGVTENKVSIHDFTDSKKVNGLEVVNTNSDCTGGPSSERVTSPSASEHTSDAGAGVTCNGSEAKENRSTNIPEFMENDCTDGLYDVPFVGEGKHTEGSSTIFTSPASGKLQSDAVGISTHYSQAGSLSNEVLDESGSTSLVVNGNSVSTRADKDTSKWQSKGKRNSRKLSKRISRMDSSRSMDRDDCTDVQLESKPLTDKLIAGNAIDESRVSDNCTQVSESKMLSEDRVDMSQWTRNDTQLEEPNYLDSIYHGGTNLGNTDHFGKERKLNCTSKGKSVVAQSTIQMRNKELCLTSITSSRRSLPHRQSRFTTYPRYHDRDESDRSTCNGTSLLYDVKLEVRASIPGQHVPLVSLMSKLNGKAIVGYPLVVHVLDDGYSDILLIGNINSDPARSNNDKTMGLTKRTTSVPIKPKAVRSTMSTKKSSKSKKGDFSPKKIRKLSSLAISNKQKEEKRKPWVENSGGSVTCVPLKVVFSRISEALKR